MFAMLSQFFIVPRLCSWPSWSWAILTLSLYAILTIISISFYRSFKVWRNSLAGKYEHQCQKVLRQFNLQLHDGVSMPTTVNGTPTLASEAVVVQSKDIGYHLTFLRRMPRRLATFLEAYREEYRGRRKYFNHQAIANKKKD